MKKKYLFEVPRFLDAQHEFIPLALEDIHLKVSEDVINEEAHMLSQEHCLSETWIIREPLHTSDLACPNVS